MRALSKLIRTALFVSAVLSLTLAGGRAQKSSATKRLLILYWYDRDYPGNVRFDQSFRGALRSMSHGTIDYYTEYLETNRFRGESLSGLLHDYLRQKYADVSIDVLVVNTPPALDFFLKYRSDLFPNVPIVFATTEFPTAEQLASGPGATGFVYLKNHREDLDLALKLHPDTEQVFIVSGADAIDTTGRKELQGYPRKVAINYLTDLPLEELLVRVKSLPERSLVLYVRQQLSDRLGKLLESQDVLALIARSSRVPIYGMVETNVGLGIVGGYVFTTDGNAAKLAELAVRVANGARPADIPVQRAPYVPMFDWRQLQRWNIPENHLPPGSIIRFREVTVWQQYKWRIVATIAIVMSQAFLIGALLVQRKRAQRTQRVLQESEERFRNMADAAPVMIWVADPNANCTFTNKSWLIFTGRTLEQEMGDGWAASIHPDDLDRCLAIFSSSLDARRNFQLEYRARRADGDYRYLLGNGVPRFRSDGRFEGYIGSCIDITDSKRAQEESLGKQKLESIGVLAGGIAHDFNNLLGGILVQAEFMEQDLPGGSSHSEELHRIKEGAIRGSEIVRELMTYSGQDKADLAPVDVAQLVEEMLRLLKVSISKHAVLQIELPKDLPAVRGNAPQLRQIVMNLVINASEAIGDKDGVIRVTLSRVAWGQDLASNGAAEFPEGDYLRLEVSDTGTGMTEKTKARLFDPFFTTKFAGRGLGLAVVQRIVRDHGGAISVVSTLRQGTTFQIDLPCAGEPAKPDWSAMVSTSDDRISNTAKTVLLVEDEDILRHAVSKMLRKQGFSVIEAGNGSAAVDLVRSHKGDIEVILLDLTIPGASSSEVVLEAQRIRPGVRVILTSAYSRGTAPASLDIPEVKDFIRKPFQMSDLVQLLRDTISAD